MIYFLLLAFALASCSPSRGEGNGIASPTPVATLQLSSPTPPVKHVAPLPQPSPNLKQKALAVAKSLPSVQVTRWRNLKIRTRYEMTVNLLVMRYEKTKGRYEVVEKMRSDGVPAPVIFCLHYRESDNDFSTHPHEGSSLLHRTRYVPKGRLPPPKEPPYKWEVSAEDAYYICDRLQGDWSSLSWAFDTMERFNGMGYRKRGLLSPYVYSGTQYYEAGKYVSDGHFSPTFVDKQLGCLAILKRLQQRGFKISFDQ